jgi:hypothetical protein
MRWAVAVASLVVACDFDPGSSSATIDASGTGGDGAATIDGPPGPDAPPGIDADAGCPPGYDTLSTSGTSSRYRHYTNQRTWLNAEIDCEDDGAGTHLVVTQTSNEHAAIVDLVSGASSPVWVGASDIVGEDTWLDVTGGETWQPDWFSGASQYPAEPNNSGDCALLSNDDLPIGERDKHFDEACGNTWQYVCECDGIAADPAAYTP